MKWKKRALEIERLKAKHGNDRSLARHFPDLSVEQRLASLSNRILPVAHKNPEILSVTLGPQFIIGHLHKSGYQILLKSDLPYAGGKKP